jgi:hypothetical protein
MSRASLRSAPAFRALGTNISVLARLRFRADFMGWILRSFQRPARLKHRDAFYRSVKRIWGFLIVSSLIVKLSNGPIQASIVADAIRRVRLTFPGFLRA